MSRFNRLNVNSVAQKVRNYFNSSKEDFVTREQLLRHFSKDPVSAIASAIREGKKNGTYIRVKTGVYQLVSQKDVQRDLFDPAPHQFKQNPDSVAGKVRALFNNTNKVWTRQEVVSMFDTKKQKACVDAELARSVNLGFAKRVGTGKYLSLIKSNGHDYDPAASHDHEEAKQSIRKYTRREKATGPTADAIIYLNHARTAMKDKDSPEYMLVSLALYTLEGKMGV